MDLILLCLQLTVHMTGLCKKLFCVLKNECIYRAKPQNIQAIAEQLGEYIYFYHHDHIPLATKLTPMEMRSGAAA